MKHFLQLDKMQNLSPYTKQIDNLKKTIDLWLVLEQKSAFSEGVIATDVLFLNNFVNLRLSAKSFFATRSPLEEFLQNTYLSPVKTELDYIQQRVDLISHFKKLLKKFSKNSSEAENIENILWLLRFQLAGFGQRLVEDGKILFGLIALKESGSLNNQKVTAKIKNIAKKSPKYASLISEFL